MACHLTFGVQHGLLPATFAPDGFRFLYSVEKTDDKGNVTQYWHRPGNAANELWDLLNYGHANVEVFAWFICIQHFELEKFDWADFWKFAGSSEYDALFGRL